MKNAASCTIDRTALSKNDVRDLNRVAKLLAKHGALSAERAAKLAKLDQVRSAHWAFFMLGATPTAMELYVWK